MTKIKLKKTSGKWLVSGVLLFLQGVLNIANAEQAKSTKSLTKLRISPEQCIALREGQVCYQNVIIEWQSQKPGDFCLYANAENESLECWQNSYSGRLAFDFQSQQSVTYRLRAVDSNIDLATVQMTVAWVYGNKKRRRASWRLF